MRIQRAIQIGIAIFFFAIAGRCPADVTFLGYARCTVAPADFSGKFNILEDGSSNGRFDGFGSGMAYTGEGNRYVLLADRGPNKTPYPGGDAVDNTTSYDCRFQIVDVTVTQEKDQWNVNMQPIGTSLLTDETGRNYVGLSTAIQSTDPTKNLRLDPESIRVAPDGSVYVSDEYGPNIFHFDPAGKRIGIIPVPDKFKVEKIRPTEKEETEVNAYVPHSGNGGGRVTNKGFEGLAISPDGSTLIAALQCPLIQDGGEKTRYTRFLVVDLRHPDAPPRELLYVLSPKKDGSANETHMSISEIVAVNDHQLIVDERDSIKRNKAKHLFLVDISGATDISNIYSLSDLSADDLAKIRPISRTDEPLIDVKALVEPRLPDDPRFLKGIPDKIEGLAFGPDLPDGRRLLLVSNDNDFFSPIGEKSYPNYIFAFAIDRNDLPGFEPEHFNFPAGTWMKGLSASAAAPK